MALNRILLLYGLCELSSKGPYSNTSDDNKLLSYGRALPYLGPYRRRQHRQHTTKPGRLFFAPKMSMPRWGQTMQVLFFSMYPGLLIFNLYDDSVGQKSTQSGDAGAPPRKRWFLIFCEAKSIGAAGDIVRKVINLPVADITRYEFYTKIRRKTPPSSLTMVGPEPSGKPTQPTTHPPTSNTTPLASNGIGQSISKHRFNTLSNFGNHAKYGTRSYTEPRTKTPPPKVITQRTHHDGTPHTSNQTNLQKNQSPRENVSLSYSKTLQQAKPNIPPSHYPHSVNCNLDDRSTGQVNSLPTPYHPPNMRKSHSKPLKPPRTPTPLPTTTQTMSQPNHNRFWTRPPAVKPHEVPVTNNKTPITQLPAIPALPTATNNRRTMPPMNQRNAITTRPSNHQPNTFNSTRHPSLQPIDCITVYSTITQQQLDPDT